MRRRRNYTPEEKVRILKRHLIDRVPVLDLCYELECLSLPYSIEPNNCFLSTEADLQVGNHRKKPHCHGNYSCFSLFTSSSPDRRSKSLSDSSSSPSRFLKYTKAVHTVTTKNRQTTKKLSILSAKRADNKGANTTYVKITDLSSSSCWLGSSFMTTPPRGFQPCLVDLC